MRNKECGLLGLHIWLVEWLMNTPEPPYLVCGTTCERVLNRSTNMLLTIALNSFLLQQNVFMYLMCVTLIAACTCQIDVQAHTRCFKVCLVEMKPSSISILFFVLLL